MNDRRKIFAGIDPALLAKFKQYHLANPYVYELFKNYASKMKASGRSRYSAWAIINLIRWHHDIKTTAKDFKISNDFIALYARVLIYREPEFDGFFQLKPMKGQPCTNTTQP
jgi:hypothetical protein